MKALSLRISAAAVRALAAIARLFAKRHVDVVLISCQYDEPSRDILDLAEALRAYQKYRPRDRGVYQGDGTFDRTGDGFSVCVIAGRMRRSFGGALLFIGKLFSMLRHVAGARVVVVDAYCMAVSIPKKRPGQKVVQLWHAPEAIKKFSLQIVDTPAGYDRKTAEILCMHRNYDYILCPSDATKPFFAEAFGYPESAFVKLGLPALDRLGLMKRPAVGEEDTPERAETRDAICEKYPDLKEGVLTIVYAPTFRDGMSVDVEGLVKAFDQTRETALVLKLHPLDSWITDGPPAGNKVPSIPSPCLIIEDKEFPLSDWYAAADVIVTDYSGVAVEAAAAGIASYYYIYDIEDYKARRGLNVDLRSEAIGKYAFTDADAMVKQGKEDFISAPLYDYDALAAFAGKYLEVPLTGNTKKLADFIGGLY